VCKEEKATAAFFCVRTIRVWSLCYTTFMAPYVLRSIPEMPEALLAYPPLLRTLLLARGITTDEEAARFLAPDWERDTHDPFLMFDMQRAVERIVRAMVSGEVIAIWSDYDMDGIPGAVILHDTFQALGYDRAVHYTPHRNKDGFGLNRAGLEELKEGGATLIITVDCGIGDGAFVEYASSIGLEVIVTDHHIPCAVLPPAYAVLNPKREGCAYPEKMLCGAGVAFKLAQALLTHVRSQKQAPIQILTTVSICIDVKVPVPGWEKWLLDMAGMATIADMVPLRGENRALAYFGLLVLRKSRRPGLQALLSRARADQRHLTEDDVGFTIAPRVNAASRMGHARDAFRLLASQDPTEAGALAEELDRINTERKTLVAVMKREIKHRIEKNGEPKEVLVMGNPEWKPSLLGLVAGGLAEEFGRPVFLWGREEGVTIKGSCRSGGGVNVYEIMHHAREHFIEYGGHAGAGGFSLSHEAVHALEEVLITAHRHIARDSALKERLVDADLSLEEVQWDTYRMIEKLAPFGEGNPKPLFCFRDVRIAGVRTFGKGGEHLELSLASGSGVRKAIAFFASPDTYGTMLVEGERVTVLAHLEASYFRNRPELRLRLVDVVR